MEILPKTRRGRLAAASVVASLALAGGLTIAKANATQAPLACAVEAVPSSGDATTAVERAAGDLVAAHLIGQPSDSNVAYMGQAAADSHRKLTGEEAVQPHDAFRVCAYEGDNQIARADYAGYAVPTGIVPSTQASNTATNR